MAERSGNTGRVLLGAGLLAAAAVGVAVFVPRRKLVLVTEPFKALGQSPMALAIAAWATGLWAEATAPRAPQFDDLRPFEAGVFARSLMGLS